MNCNPRILGFADGRSSKIHSPLSGIENAEVITTSDRTGFSKYSSLVRHGVERIDGTDPDVLLSNHPGRLGATVVALGRLTGVPVVIRIAGDMWKTNYEELRQEFVDRNALRAVARGGQIGLNELFSANADGYLVVSEELQDLVVERTGCSPKQVRRIPVPIDAESYQMGNPVDGRNRIDRDVDRTLLTVTNLRFQGKLEGAKQLVRGVAPLLKSNPDLIFVIAGGGRYLDDLRRYVERAIPDSIRDQVILAGFVSNIADLYAAADVFAYCSYIDGYPNVVSEAMAAGLPIVANADHGMVEQLTHKETGLLVDSTEPGEFTRAIQRVLSNDGLATRLGSSAQQRVSTRNDPDRIGREMISALDRILDATAATSR